MAERGTAAGAGPPEADAPVPGTAEPEARQFSFACFPAERVMVLVGMLAGPGIAWVVVREYLRMADLAGQSSRLTAFDPGDSRIFAGLTVLAAGLLLLYGGLYLQLRSATHAWVGARGLRLERPAILPFGLLGKSREVSWEHAVRVELRQRRTWLGATRPTLEVESAAGTLRLSVADAWEVPGPSRPWAPKAPDGDWSKSALVVAATTAFEQVAFRPEKAASLKSESMPTDLGS